ncbi:LamB/YcsF family protein [Paenibacillus sp. HN-1]|uniref:LamB/YcsF family protein n=1 Tax=Paenibacillus TaxID=44249 RepID=UPI001CA86F45|nr:MULTISPECIES: 5-oxoprolinase subunit PxpA [Paenibacillus]MBY9079701.1 LamB/YcsF family protein [Paenibacillus sp. CGMCC 1.18879]MBY9082952.1 LamB/YcsF family protein [Paenibacillus sinensis]
MIEIDLNCDMGESFGAYTIGNDDELLREVTSANIACGFHAGDPAVMRRSVTSALAAGVNIGAHPGLPDLAGFGRRNMQISPEEAFDLVTYQIGALAAFVRQEGGRLRHVKPHGALYNMAAASRPLADAIAGAVCRFDPALVLYGLAGSELLAAGNAAGLRTASEVFADRAYMADGSLVPRGVPGAVIHDAAEAAGRVLRMVREGAVTALDGSAVPLLADTVCIHGDSPGAAGFAAALRRALEAEGIRVSAGG